MLSHRLRLRFRLLLVSAVACAGAFLTAGRHAPFQAPAAQASCTPPDPLVGREHAELAFVGVVRAMYQDTERELAGFEVEVVYKGDVPKWIISNTPKAGTSWEPVQVGHRYWVFSKTDPPRLFECSVGDTARPEASAYITPLGSGRPPDVPLGLYFPYVPPTKKGDPDACACDLSANTEGLSSGPLVSAGIAVVFFVLRRTRTKTKLACSPKAFARQRNLLS